MIALSVPVSERLEDLNDKLHSLVLSGLVSPGKAQISRRALVEIGAQLRALAIEVRGLEGEARTRRTVDSLTPGTLLRELLAPADRIAIRSGNDRVRGGNAP